MFLAELATKLQQANARNNENAQQRANVENIAERGEELAGQIEAAQAELIYCALGLSFGYITVFWRGKYEASLAK